MPITTCDNDVRRYNDCQTHMYSNAIQAKDTNFVGLKNIYFGQ